ncbi:low-density lipoprotein receptor-related protein 1B-like [Saccostrea echinata]|uniref:low-density lipoprotein receptor-related protein 1B-like n=1 Tax=Saccostrea echinata TaxID=191078 RepID=UPI002A8225DF|nr:low-density lipoprotein receptor-related protein 1B-like [Saccostrea echinata]
MGPNGSSFFFAEKNFIKESNFDTTVKRIEDALTIYSLSVDIHNRILAWTTSENYYIQISTLEGKDVRQIMQSLDINYLVSDPLSQRIFWGTKRGIMSVNNDGNNVRVIRRLNYTMQSLNILQGLVIWTEYQSTNSTSICSADYRSIEISSSCISYQGSLSNIFIQDAFLRSLRDNCAVGNGGCDQLCISGSTSKCFCYEGYARQNGSTECRKENGTVHLFAIDGVTNTVYGVDSTFEILKNFSKEKNEIIDVDIDVHTGDLYTLQGTLIKHLQFSIDGNVSSHSYYLEGMIAFRTYNLHFMNFFMNLQIKFSQCLCSCTMNIL